MQMIVTSGVGAALDMLAHAIGDPGGEYIVNRLFLVRKYIKCTLQYCTMTQNLV